MTQELPKPGDVLRRTVTVERASLETRAKGDERIPISISSEEPCERYFGREILVHTREAIDLVHARDGLPFLADHDGTRQLGLVEDVTLREDGKLGGFLRKGNHPDAGWYFADIESGIRKNISVGYRIDAMDPNDDKSEWRATRWTPMECSTVSVPADITVGVGRSAPHVIPIRFEIESAAKDEPAKKAKKAKREEGTDVGPCANDGCGHDYAQHEDEGMHCMAQVGEAMCPCPGYVQSPNTPDAPRSQQVNSPAPSRPKEQGMSEHTDSAAPHKTGPVAVSLEDKQREMADIVRLGNEHGMQDKVAGWLDRGLNRDQACAEILAEKGKQATAVTAPGHLDLSPRDAMKFSYTRAMTNLLTQRWEQFGGFEKEVSDAVSKRTNRSTSGFFIPLDLPVITRAAATGNIAATSSLGGAGVQTSILSLIDLLRNKMMVRQLGATVLSGLSGNISFPRHIVANTMAWEGENPASAHTATAATFDNVTLSPKTAMASSAYSRQLLIQESFDISSFIQNDLAKVLAVGLDLAALDGTGANSQPTGVMRQTGVTSITHGGAQAGIPTWAEMVSYETNVANNNADIGTMAFLTNPSVRGKLKTVLKSTTAGSTYIWESDNTINGYRAEASVQIPSNYTFGTQTTLCSGAIFGVWDELLIGEWGGALEVIVDPYTLAGQNMVAVTQMILADVAVRHPKSFAVSKSILIA